PPLKRAQRNAAAAFPRSEQRTRPRPVRSSTCRTDTQFRRECHCAFGSFDNWKIDQLTAERDRPVAARDRRIECLNDFLAIGDSVGGGPEGLIDRVDLTGMNQRHAAETKSSRLQSIALQSLGVRQIGPNTVYRLNIRSRSRYHQC